jgi:hypothetical protein
LNAFTPPVVCEVTGDGEDAAEEPKAGELLEPNADDAPEGLKADDPDEVPNADEDELNDDAVGLNDPLKDPPGGEKDNEGRAGEDAAVEPVNDEEKSDDPVVDVPVPVLLPAAVAPLPPPLNANELATLEISVEPGPSALAL